MGPGKGDLNPVLVFPRSFCYESPWKHSELSSYQDVLPGKHSHAERWSSSLLPCALQNLGRAGLS